MSYEIQDIGYSDDYFVHQRNLGQKVSGAHLYPNVPWSDVVLQHVPIEVPMRLTHRDYLIGESLGAATRYTRGKDEPDEPVNIKTTIVGDRHVDMNIRVSEDTIGMDAPG